jgi:hypothetical protein
MYANPLRRLSRKAAEEGRFVGPVKHFLAAAAAESRLAFLRQWLVGSASCA